MMTAKTENFIKADLTQPYHEICFFPRFSCNIVPMQPYPIIEVSLESAEYPERLRQISQPPKILYCRGNIALLQTECLAVVGTRMITHYGKEVVDQIVPSLAHQFTIVSGLAIGIDAAAHKTTLAVNGKAIAVLGGPVDDPAPQSNVKLANDILGNNGLLISEYESGATVYPSNFAIRDRIISGLSRGVLVVEADEKSGSLITAHHALDQNRDVFAIPGPIFSPKSRGANILIQRGAKLVASVADILGDYSMLDLKPVSTENPTEASILAILETNGPQSVDAMIRESGVEAAELMATLSIMEVKGLIHQMSGGTYRKI